MKIGWPLSLTKRSGIPKLADISIVVSLVTFGIIFTLSHFEWLSTKTINILFMVFMNGPAESTCTLCQGVLGLLGQSRGCKGACGGLLQNRTTTCTRYVLVRPPHMNPTPPCARCPGDLRVKFVKIPLSLALAMVEEWLRAFPTKDNSLRPWVRDICWNTALEYWLIYLLGWPSVMSKYTPTLLTKLDRRVSLYERARPKIQAVPGRSHESRHSYFGLDHSMVILINNRRLCAYPLIDILYPTDNRRREYM